MNDDLRMLEDRAAALARDHRELLQGLTRLRRVHDLTQAEVADRMGVSQSAVSQFERYDANPTLATIRRYALAVGARLETRITDVTLPARVEAWGQHWQEADEIPGVN